MPAKGKGGGFEREVSRMLTKWWTGGDDTDDLFWRTSNSGGRSTVRRKKGKRSSGHDADIGATSPEGAPLCRLIAFEVKRGYNHVTLHTLLDRNPKRRQPGNKKKRIVLPIEAWVNQAETARQRAGAHFWAIVHKRDTCEPVIYLPYTLVDALGKEGAFPKPITPWATFGSHVRSGPGEGELMPVVMAATRFDLFLKHAHPDHVRAALARKEKPREGQTGRPAKG